MRVGPHLLLAFTVALAGGPTTAARAESFERLQADVMPDFQPGNGSTEGGLWMLMEKAEQDISRAPNRIADPQLEGYLKDLCCRLAPDYCSDIRVYVMRVPHFNASMAPNGMMMVWSGLLLRARNEAQLAAVLGHEIGHYLKRHSLQRFASAKNTASLMTFLSLGLAGAATAGGINAATAQTADLVGQFTLIGGFFAYSRSQEREADQFGVQLLADAAYDAAEASAIWRNMLDEEAAATQQGDKPFFFFATHPQSESRMDGLAEYADQLQAAGGATVETNREAYQQHVYPQLGVMLADELDLHQSGRTEFLLRGLLADGVAPGLLNYSLGELYRIRNGAGDRELALQQYETALQFDDVPPDAFRSLGLLYLKDRRHELANSQFRNYLDASPEAPDREMIEYYMTMGGTPQ